ncbi:hypothetical protein R80B4_03223 [Fibrobacteres bacterium R8-0-B4]
MRMKKSLSKYMNDPDIINEPAALREIHAIRLMMYDETKNLTSEEHTAYFRNGAERFATVCSAAD